MIYQLRTRSAPRELFTRHYSTPASEVASRKVDQAAKGARQSSDIKIRQIADYVCHVAQTLRCDIDDIDCPTQQEWDSLAAGQNPQLPSRTLLALWELGPFELAFELGRAVAKEQG